MSNTTALSAADQAKLVCHKAVGALNSLNCPAPYDSRIPYIVPFLRVEDRTELDPSDARDVHFSERRRIEVPRVFVVNADGSLRTKPGLNGEHVPFPIERMVAELADSNVQVRWLAPPNQHRFQT